MKTCRISFISPILILFYVSVIYANTNGYQKAEHLLSRGGIFALETTKDSIAKARRLIAGRKLSGALRVLNNIKGSDTTSAGVLYLKGEIQLIYGRNDVIKIMEELEKRGEHALADLLKLKTKFSLGDKSLLDDLSWYRKTYGDSPEVRLIDWLYRLDMGEYSWAKENRGKVEKDILFSYIPIYALYIRAMDENRDDARMFLRELKGRIGYTDLTVSCLLELDSIKARGSKSDAPGTPVEIELPFYDNGYYFGIMLEDSTGNKVTLTVDTGTGSGLLTVHNLETGKKIAGRDADTIPKGIFYRYMKKPEDLYLKMADFAKPHLKDFPVFYFNGSFGNTDGVFSPFVFKDYAISIDAPGKKVFLRNRSALNEYLNGPHMKMCHETDYIVRNGWIYIPCKVNNREVLMMIESGSSNVNFNRLSAEYLGLEVYQDSILWRDKYYKTKEADALIEIGPISYQVKGGLIDDFMLGNHYYGAGSAGDIGPDFLRQYPFTIDPFRRKIIFEINAAADKERVVN